MIPSEYSEMDNCHILEVGRPVCTAYWTGAGQIVSASQSGRETGALDRGAGNIIDGANLMR